MRHYHRLLMFTVALEVLVSLPVIAQDSTAVSSNVLALGDPNIYSKSLAALTILFVLAVLLENAFSTIFNWRVFLTYFSLRGVKTLIMVLVSLLIVIAFDVDVVANLIAAYKATTPQPGPTSRFITALILAGGSAGVYNIMHALGYRNDRREQEVAARPPKTEAWIAVRVDKRAAVGNVQVLISKLRAAGGASDPLPIAGIAGMKSPSLRELFLRSRNRYPQNGGHALEPNHVYHIVVRGEDANGGELTALDEDYVFAPGAIVDFEVTL